MQKRVFKGLSGILLILLPILILIVGAISPINNQNWWHSISASYYNMSTKTVYYISFLLLCIFLYLSGAPLCRVESFLLLLILFIPCADATIPNLPDRVGILDLSCNFSDTIHSICCCVLFLSFVLQVSISLRYRKHKTAYIVILIALLISMLIIIAEITQHTKGNWTYHKYTIVAETLMFSTAGFYFLIESSFLRYYREQKLIAQVL